jgi:hypothetical protein
MVIVRLLGQEGLAIKPNLRPVPTFITVSGRIDVVSEEETRRTNGNRLTSFAFASVKLHLYDPLLMKTVQYNNSTV